MADAKVVFEKVRELIVNQLPVKAADVKPESRLIEDLGADSANMLILVCDMEGEFGITVDNEAITTIKTMDDAVKYLQRELA